MYRFGGPRSRAKNTPAPSKTAKPKLEIGAPTDFRKATADIPPALANLKASATSSPIVAEKPPPRPPPPEVRSADKVKGVCLFQSTVWTVLNITDNSDGSWTKYWAKLQKEPRVIKLYEDASEKAHVKDVKLPLGTTVNKCGPCNGKRHAIDVQLPGDQSCHRIAVLDVTSLQAWENAIEQERTALPNSPNSRMMGEQVKEREELEDEFEEMCQSEGGILQALGFVAENNPSPKKMNVNQDQKQTPHKTKPVHESPLNNVRRINTRDQEHSPSRQGKARQAPPPPPQTQSPRQKPQSGKRGLPHGILDIMRKASVDAPMEGGDLPFPGGTEDDVLAALADDTDDAESTARSTRGSSMQIVDPRSRRETARLSQQEGQLQRGTKKLENSEASLLAALQTADKKLELVTSSHFDELGESCTDDSYMTPSRRPSDSSSVASSARRGSLTSRAEDVNHLDGLLDGKGLIDQIELLRNLYLTEKEKNRTLESKIRVFKSKLKQQSREITKPTHAPPCPP
eukprot:m.75381 g.75381  ORF g.75381 m.75381 type:complete len:514 (-) comp12498_c0_seq2:56-1597(-)